MKTAVFPRTNEQDQIARQLQESQARLAGIITSAMDAIITVDESQDILLFNAAAEKMFGYPARQILGQPLDILLPERFREQHRSHIRSFADTGVTNRSMGKLGTLYGLRSGGEEFPIEASISQVEFRGGRLFTVILRDVTERVQAESALVESRQYLEATFEQSAVGIAHIAPDGRWLRVNQRLAEITGFSREELLGKSIQDITHPADLETDMELQQRVSRGEIETYNLEKRYIRKDGKPVWVNIASSRVSGPRGEIKYLIKIIEDISLRKEAEAALRARTEEIQSMTQQLWQAAKLATVGELAASIAHELNNPLAILSLRIEAMMSEIPDDTQVYQDLRVMEGEVDRMAALVANLLQFSRSGQRQISSLDVREEMDRTLQLIQTHLRHRRIEVQRDFAASLPLIQADRQQLRQLFLNLFTNASDAMPEGGRLTLLARARAGSTGVSLAVRDTGQGIPPEQQSQIMDPFFTTKAEGKGTGLGLSICKRIVEEHNGSIQVTSPGPGQGTQVLIDLPGENSSRPGLLFE